MPVAVIMALLLVCLVLLVAGSEDAAGATTDLIVPRPANLERTGPGFALDPTTAIVADADPEVAAVARFLGEHLHRGTGYAFGVDASGRARSGAVRLTREGADAALGPEGYELTVSPEGAAIRAPGLAGLFYGAQSLRQLLPPEIEGEGGHGRRSWELPGVYIRDEPRFPVRGFMLDSCRHIQSVEFIRRMIDLLAFHKINTFHWHLTEDQGWRLEIRGYPRLTQVGAWRDDEGGRYGGFYTQTQVREIVKYAAARFVTVVPEVDMPGHMVAAVTSYPELGCTGGPYEVRREWGISEDVLCLGKPQTFRFAEEVLSEVMELFPSKVIHIGGDECPRDRWCECAHCQELIRREGLPDEDALQNYFTSHIARFLHERGRRLQGWNEIMVGGSLPKDVIVHQWNWEWAGDEAARWGNDVVYSMHPDLYFDKSIEDLPMRKVYECQPVPEDLEEEYWRHILGPEACLWTEYRPTEESDDEFTWPRAIALAEAGWTYHGRREWSSFAKRMRDGHYRRVARIGLGCAGASPDEVEKTLIARSGFE